ncbi:Heterokaryon incompatibility protein (HET) domain containing protein [Rhypophila decipiens]
MRLINADTLEFEEFLDPSSVQYAILSHTWEAEEVSFSDMTNNWKPSVKKKAGFVKIRETCRLARQRKLKYVWIDTCCIDKTSSAELSEAINSMFNWYAQSYVCFAQLSDLRPGLGITAKDLAHCRWISRGWTLQELIAPGNLELYDAEWTLRGTKHQFWQAIQEASGISKDGLLNFKRILDSSEGPGFPVAQRMYWASRRETTRPEDMAYCLFGLFDVNMPLLYGEGGLKAFMRLQSAILEATQDLSILAWKLPDDSPLLRQSDGIDKMEVDQETTETACGVLAPHPNAFDHSVSQLFRDSKKVYYRGPEEFGYSSHLDGSLVRIKAPRVTLLKGMGDRMFLATGVSFHIKDGTFRSVWIPLAQLGKVYGRADATSEPTLSRDSTKGVVPLEEMSLISNSARTLNVGKQASTVRFDTNMPKTIIVHKLDAAPKDSWNPLSQVLSVPGLRWDGTGYLRICLRRIDGGSPDNIGAFYVPSWLDRVAFVVPFETSEDYDTSSEEPYETWEYYIKFQFFARPNDGSTPKDWFPRIWSSGGRTHFGDEASILVYVMDGLYHGHALINEGVIYVGDSTVNQAVRCKVVATTLSTRNTSLNEKPQKFELKLEVEDIPWTTAVEESARTGVPLTDYRQSLPVNVNVQIGSGLTGG